jgi:sugar phosphate isomerase/epimerase
MLPEKQELPRAKNFDFLVAGFSELAPVLEKADARIVIEGWPGPGALCCTPETLRALFERIPSPSMGINYDPSHLVRMGIDPLRFLREFASRVHHMHAKDTELLPERLYLLGSEQPATFTPGVHWGGNHWRYTIPGHGVVPWSEVLRILADAGYKGCISVELEDVNFNGAAHFFPHVSGKLLICRRPLSSHGAIRELERAQRFHLLRNQFHRDDRHR